METTAPSQPLPPSATPGEAGAAHGRVRVDGKAFRRFGRPFRADGVTYGPFPPDARGDAFPPRRRVAEDFAQMRAASVGAVRTYHVPPDWVFGLAEEYGLVVLVDVPWAKHLCFLGRRSLRDEARAAVRGAARRGRRFTNVLAYSVGNEIPADVVRWHGAARVERFLGELADEARQADPEGLVTFANFPPTEYLRLPFLDFATFNVYLHDPGRFHAYLARLQNLVGDRPLVLGELGMDTFRHGEDGQARFLGGHLREAGLMGLAGAFVFSWTDEWFTGGHAVGGWAFGVTDARRMPKPSYRAVAEAFSRGPAGLLGEAPRVSVVVCTYNGGRTLDGCLRSLRALDYPNYEVVVVDDGSTDDTREILGRFPEVRAVRQENRGLGVARNVGLRESGGEVVAYTDSDCVADPGWLTCLVHQLRRSGAEGVGGPNLTPEDGWLSACVAASPGQPTHVLEGDEEAEHVPGCNMAFRREALEAIGGFDPRYRKAGDDVDICLRVQQAGGRVTFAPGAFVWHHRRQNPSTYLRQQAGYGEAEALLRFKYPDRFTTSGNGRWRGVLYGASLQGFRLARPRVFRGPLGSGLFQTLYQPCPAHWATLPSTLEWHAGVLLVALVAAAAWPGLWFAAVAGLALSLAVAAAQAAAAGLAPRHRGWRSRAVVAGLCYAQPVVRSWARYRTRLRGSFAPRAPGPRADPSVRLDLSGRRAAAYWSEQGRRRGGLVRSFSEALESAGWSAEPDSGWTEWDLSVHCGPALLLDVGTAEEEHGSGRLLVRVRARLRASAEGRALGGLTAACALAVTAGNPRLGAFAAAAAVAALAAVWVKGLAAGSRALAVFGLRAAALGMTRCDEAGAKGEPRPSPAGPAVDGGWVTPDAYDDALWVAETEAQTAEGVS